MGTHMPHGITQCYLPPGRGDIPTLTPAKAGTRLSNPACSAVQRRQSPERPILCKIFSLIYSRIQHKTVCVNYKYSSVTRNHILCALVYVRDGSRENKLWSGDCILKGSVSFAGAHCVMCVCICVITIQCNCWLVDWHGCRLCSCWSTYDTCTRGTWFVAYWLHLLLLTEILFTAVCLFISVCLLARWLKKTVGSFFVKSAESGKYGQEEK